jgi:VCBS repeat-containing protein
LQAINLAGLLPGVTQSGNTLLVDTGNAAFQDLAAGVQRQIVVTYDVSDGKGGSTAQSATVMTVIVTGANDPAVIGSTAQSLGRAERLVLKAVRDEGRRPARRELRTARPGATPDTGLGVAPDVYEGSLRLNIVSPWFRQNPRAMAQSSVAL